MVLLMVKTEKEQETHDMVMMNKGEQYHKTMMGVEEVCWLTFVNFIQTRLSWEDGRAVGCFLT